jgi:hypothetical protein
LPTLAPSLYQYALPQYVDLKLLTETEWGHYIRPWLAWYGAVWPE